MNYYDIFIGIGLEGREKHDIFTFNDVPQYRLLLAAIPMNIPTLSPFVPESQLPLAECKTKCPVDFKNNGNGDEKECVKASLEE